MTPIKRLVKIGSSQIFDQALYSPGVVGEGQHAKPFEISKATTRSLFYYFKRSYECLTFYNLHQSFKNLSLLTSLMVRFDIMYIRLNRLQDIRFNGTLFPVLICIPFNDRLHVFYRINIQRG